MRWLCTLLMFALLTLPVVAGADELDASTKERTILMSEDYNPSSVTTSYSLLKKLRGRIGGYGKLDKYEKIKIRIRLYEFSPNKNGVRRRIEVRPQIGDSPGLMFIYRF